MVAISSKNHSSKKILRKRTKISTKPTSCVFSIFPPFLFQAGKFLCYNCFRGRYLTNAVRLFMLIGIGDLSS